MFACYNGNCVSPSALCNGIDECGDLSDEMNPLCDQSTEPPPTTQPGINNLLIVNNNQFLPFY